MHLWNSTLVLLPKCMGTLSRMPLLPTVCLQTLWHTSRWAIRRKQKQYSLNMVPYNNLQYLAMSTCMHTLAMCVCFIHDLQSLGQTFGYISKNSLVCWLHEQVKAHACTPPSLQSLGQTFGYMSNTSPSPLAQDLVTHMPILFHSLCNYTSQFRVTEPKL